MSIRYCTIIDCQQTGFPFIHRSLTAEEPAPNYEAESTGIEELKKVLAFARSNEYYPTFADKAAYLICSIAASQYFTNGNKRLAVVVLLLFLTANTVLIRTMTQEQTHELMRGFFPKIRWKNNRNISGWHALFLYNLTLVLGNRKIWSTDDFVVLREKVAKMFGFLYRINID